uniref:Uncharacterized protein n=1 Tax=Arundo donax TaxID=35708 RepID=A0A0A8XR84_ARUDO
MKSHRTQTVCLRGTITDQLTHPWSKVPSTPVHASLFPLIGTNSRFPFSPVSVRLMCCWELYWTKAGFLRHEEDVEGGLG